MKKIRTHISIPLDTDILVHRYMDNYGCKYSQAVERLIEIGSKNILLEKVVDRNNSFLDKIYSKIYYSTALLEQFYTNFEFEDTPSPYDDKALKRFKNKFNKYNIDD